MNARAEQRPSGVAAATAATIAFFAAAVFPRATSPLTDPDVWWHIRAGEDILRTGSVARTDTWSIAGAGREWTSQDWLANVILAAGDSQGPWGATGLSLLFGALTVLAFWILWRAIALRAPTIGWASRIIWLSAGLLLAGPVMGVRVQVLDLLLAAVVIWLLWGYLADRRPIWVLGLPAVAVAWANLHAGWVLLFLLGGAVLVGEAVDRLAHRSPDGQPLTWRQEGLLALALVTSAGTLVLNPNGVDLLAYPFMTVGITALNQFVLEWNQASLENLFGWLLLGFVVLGVIPALVLGRSRLRTADALVLIGLTVMAWQAIRFLLILGPIGGAVVAIVLSPVISRSRAGQRFSPMLLRLAKPRGGVLGMANRVLIGVLLLIGMGVALARVVPGAQEKEIARRLPAGAVAWMDANEPGERIFNRYEWGGYIGQHRPDELIFMDGRADVYGDELLRMYVSVISLDVDPQTILDRYQIDHAMLPPDWDLAAWFDGSPAWVRAYADATAVVWVRAR